MCINVSFMMPLRRILLDFLAVFGILFDLATPIQIEMHSSNSFHGHVHWRFLADSFRICEMMHFGALPIFSQTPDELVLIFPVNTLIHQDVASKRLVGSKLNALCTEGKSSLLVDVIRRPKDGCFHSQMMTISLNIPASLGENCQKALRERERKRKCA